MDIRRIIEGSRYSSAESLPSDLLGSHMDLRWTGKHDLEYIFLYNLVGIPLFRFVKVFVTQVPFKCFANYSDYGLQEDATTWVFTLFIERLDKTVTGPVLLCQRNSLSWTNAARPISMCPVKDIDLGEDRDLSGFIVFDGLDPTSEWPVGDNGPLLLVGEIDAFEQPNEYCRDVMFGLFVSDDMKDWHILES